MSFYRQRVQTIRTINVLSVVESPDGANNLPTRASHVKRHVRRASTPLIAATNNAKEIKIASTRSDPKKAATVSLVVQKGKT